MRVRVALLLGLLTLGILVGVAVWKTGGRPPALEARETRPQGVMGTSCRLVAVAERGRGGIADAALEAAEAELRRLESVLSTWIEVSELSRLNQAPAGEPFPVSAETRAVLESAREHFEATEGAFDITCGPLIDRWREAAKSGELPDRESLARSRAASSWDLVTLGPEGVVKGAREVRFDVSANAKGFAIDRAIDAMREAGARGGLVDVGGDLRVFGRPPFRESWEVEVRNPRGEGTLGTLALSEGAVCTSGDYARPVLIGGRSYSHIVDPRTLRPVASTPSVTVRAPSALEADSWATALSVLGPEGLALLPPGLEALVVAESGEGLKAHASPGFPLGEEDLRLTVEPRR